MEVVSNEVAEREITSWLDHKKIRGKKRESNSDQVEALIDATMDGALTFDEDSGELTQNLSDPVGEGGHLTKIVFKPRLKMSELHRHLKGVGSSDVDARMLAYIAAITNQPKSLILDMDSTDYSIATSIALFFM